MDTIFATSSGSPPAAIAIVRVSGPQALASGRALAGRVPPFRTAALRALHDPADGRLLDRALILAFEGPRTATGEDVVEFHVHGGRAVVAALEAVLARLPGLRRAEPGEFTRRALTTGVIDLTEAEGLADLLSAETEAQRRAALRIAEGGLRTLVEGWATRLVEVAARTEAMLDFAEEGDVELQTLAPLVCDIDGIAQEIEALLATPPVERLRDGIRVVLAGPPNSGKSTLLNRLAERDVAIVSPIAGTTRDRIEAPVVRDGVAYVLTDTAGLTDATDDVIERIGIERAQAAIVAADIVLWLGDTSPNSAGALWIRPRADLAGREGVEPGGPVLAVSAQTGAGVSELWALVAKQARELAPAVDQVATNQRQHDLLGQGVRYLCTARETGDLLIFAEELRLALRTLDEIVGRAGVDAVLDALFSRFCLGK